MSTDQAPHETTDRTSSRAGLIVGVIGVLLVIVIVCGLQLRNNEPGPTPTRSNSNLTSIQPDTPPPVDGLADMERAAVSRSSTPAEEDNSRALPSPQASKDPSGTSADDLPPSTEPSDAAVRAPSTAPDAVTRVATLAPTEIEGIERAATGPWQPATFAGQRYEQALCMVRSSGQSSSQVSFSLNRKFEQFSGLAGLQDLASEAPSNGPTLSMVVFRIYGDANLLWDSDPLTTAGATERFQVNVAGLDSLTLVVENQSETDGAQPAWADLQLVPAPADDLPPGGDVGQP